MISLGELARLAAAHEEALDLPIASFTLAGRTFETDHEPVIMGVVNLSRDSNYRESIAVDTESAVRKAQVQHAEGAHVIDVGAESSRPDASRLAPVEQTRTLVPVIEQLADAGVPVSIESYDPSVVRSGLKAGARLLNLTGSQSDDEMFSLAAEYDAAVVMCHVLGAHARDLDGSDVEADPVPTMLESFDVRIERARELGVADIAIDPGLGFGFRMDDTRSRTRHQATTLLNSFRLRPLGVPLCQALPHAFDFFEDQFRHAEGFFAVLAHLGGAGIYRTHEVPLLRAVLSSLQTFDVTPDETT